MKTLFLALLLTGSGLWAQTPTVLPAPNPAAGASNRDELLRRTLESAMAGQTNAMILSGNSATQAIARPLDRATLPAPNEAAMPATANPPALAPAAPTTNTTVGTTPSLGTSAPAMTAPPAALPAVPTAAIPAPPISATPAALGTNATPAAPPATVAAPTMTPPPGGAALPAPTQPAAAPPAAGAPSEGEEMIPGDLINWTGADFNQVLMIYGELVNRTILRAPTLAAPLIMLKTQTPLTKKEAILALEKVLALSGIALINIGEKFVVAVPGAQAPAEAAPWNKVNVEQLPDMGQYITRVIQTTNVKPSSLQQVLQTFASARIPNPIIPIDDNQMLILRDYTENVKRMLEMIKQLDVSVPADFISEVIPIKYAKASEIASALSSLSGGGGGTTSMGTPRGAGGRGGAGGMGRGGFGGGMGTPGYQPGAMGAPGALGAAGGLGGTPAGTPSGGGNFSDRLNAIIRRAASSTGELQIIGQTKIIADERTNALLVFAFRQDMDMIKDIISKLDVVLAQVLIESVILDVNLSDNAALGLSYLPQKPNSIGNSFNGIGALNNVGFLTPGVFSAVTNGAGSLSSGFSYLGRFGQDLDVTLTALAASSAIKVVQRPSIMTFHATPASVFIGSTVPYVTASYYGGGYAGGPASSYTPLQVGIEVDVTPYINPDGLVVMTISENISEVSGSTAITGVGNVPNTTQRTLTSEVAVKDRETIVLGGFIRTSTDNEKSGMPILKDIPLIGTLFTSSSRNKARSELMVLMRPTVLKTPEIAAAETTAIKRKLPGVRSAEAESEEYEAKRAKIVDEDLGGSKTPPAAKPSEPGPGRDAQGFLPLNQPGPTQGQEGK